MRSIVDRIRGLFQDERSFWRLATLVFGGIAILKGLRLPNAWAKTQAQLDYSHGFVKRGLLGAIYGAMGVRHDHPLTAVFFVELLIFFAVLALLTLRSKFELRVGSLALAAMFWSSYVLTFLTHLVGYTDIVLAALTMLLVLIRQPIRRFWIGIPVTVAALLIHESFLLMFLPVVLFSFVVDGALEADRKGRGRIATCAAALCVVALGMTLFAALEGSISPAQVDRMHAEVLARVDFVPRDDFFTVLKVSFLDNLRQGSRRFLQVRWYGVLLMAACLLGPVLGTMLFFGRRLLQQRAPEAFSPWFRWVPIAGVAAILVPQSMHLLGIDALRWYVASTLAAYLCLTTLSMRLPAGAIEFTDSNRRWIFFVIALNLASGYGLYDQMQIRPFPFFPGLFH